MREERAAAVAEALSISELYTLVDALSEYAHQSEKKQERLADSRGNGSTNGFMYAEAGRTREKCEKVRELLKEAIEILAI